MNCNYSGNSSMVQSKKFEMNREACKQKWHANNSLLFTSTHDGEKSVECNSTCKITISTDTKSMLMALK